MKIQTQSLPIVPKYRLDRPEPPQDVRPYAESWQVDGARFASTRALTAAAAQVNGKSARFLFTTVADRAPFSRSERIRNAAGSGLAFGLGGAVAGAVAGGALVFMAGLGNLLSAVMMGNPGEISHALVTVPVALGTAGGLGFGAVEGWKDQGKAEQSSVEGTLKVEHLADGSSALAFYPNGQLDRRVDLTRYQNAPEATMSQPQEGRPSPAWNRVKGAVAGAMAPAAVMIPLAGLAGGTVAGAAVGEALDRRTSLGAGLGAVLGAGFTVGSVAAMAQAFNHGNLVPLALLSSLGAATGAYAGDAVFSGDRQPRPEYGNSWWTAYQSKDS